MRASVFRSVALMISPVERRSENPHNARPSTESVTAVGGVLHAATSAITRKRSSHREAVWQIAGARMVAATCAKLSLGGELSDWC